MIILNNDLYEFETECSVLKLDNGLLIVDYPKENNKHKIHFHAKGPRFDIISEALEEATFINHITGKPFVRTSILYRNIFLSAINNLQFSEELNLDPIIINQVDINKLNYNLIKLVCKEWIKTVI